MSEQIREQIAAEDIIRMITAFLTRYKVSERTAVATQIYNALFTIGYRPPALKLIGDARDSLEELLKAMHDYELDVDVPPPYVHKQMIKQAKKVLAQLTADQQAQG